MRAFRRASSANIASIATRMPDNERVLIVTGASSGIGAALARTAADAGYRVAIVARRVERLEKVARAIRDAGGTVVSVAGDVTAGDMPGRIVATAMSSFGRIDAIVNNAGAGAFGALLDQTDAAIEAQWRLHVIAPLKLSRAALPHLEAARGQLVFIGSGVVRVPLPNYGAYALAKAAVRAAATQLRRELRDRGVAVTYVDPGLVATEFHEAMGIERRGNVSAASPERVAAAFRLVLSDPRVKVVLVNIFAGINRCDWIAQGVVQAARDQHISVPIVARLAGTNVEEGRRILSESGLAIIPAESLADAARKAVAAMGDPAVRAGPAPAAR